MRSWRYLALILILIQGCSFGRERLEQKALAHVARDFETFRYCDNQDVGEMPKITVGKEAFYDWLAKEIQYPSGDIDALEHELHHFFSQKATKACLEEQATFYRTQYLKTKRYLRAERAFR